MPDGAAVLRRAALAATLLPAVSPPARADSAELAIHGYGELHYNNPVSGAKVPRLSEAAAMDFHRFVWGVSYRFRDAVILHTNLGVAYPF